MDCTYCRDLNEEKQTIEVSQVHITDGYYDYNIPIKYCPACGTILKRYKRRKHESSTIHKGTN
jgi:hypothetical protein